MRVFSSLPLLLAAATLSLASPVWAQTTEDSPVNGKALFEDTPGASQISTLTSSCINCHTSIQERRAAVSGSNAMSPAITFDLAMTRFTRALQDQPSMAQFKQLSEDQVRDIGAYIADTPSLNATELTFTATAANTISAAQAVTLKAPAAPLAALVITNIAIAGTGAANFTPTHTCDNKTFAAGESCTLEVRYSPRDTTASNPVLTLTMKEGASGTAFTRRVILNGSVGSTPTTPAPTTPSANEGDSGGGALDGAALGGLVALAGASLALNRTRRRRG